TFNVNVRRVSVRSSAWLGLLCRIGLRDELLILLFCECPNCPAVTKAGDRPNARVNEDQRGGQRIFLSATEHKSHDDEHGKSPSQKAVLHDELRLAFLAQCLPSSEALWHLFVHARVIDLTWG